MSSKNNGAMKPKGMGQKRERAGENETTTRNNKEERDKARKNETN